MKRLIYRFFQEKPVEIGNAMRVPMAPEALMWLFYDWMKDNAPEYHAAPELLEALEAVEWLSIRGTGQYGNRCPWCYHLENDGHAHNCQRQIALANAGAILRGIGGGNE